MEWFIHDGQRRIGPMTGDALRAMVTTGKVSSDTLIWRPGMETWTKASLVSGLMTPPPIPPSGAATLKEEAPTDPAIVEVPEMGKPALDDEDDGGRTRAHPTDLATPWRRYWARVLDITVFSLLIGVAIGAVMPSLFAGTGPFSGPGGDSLLGWLILPVVMIVDGLVLGLFGTTPGKAIAGIQVCGVRRKKPAIGDGIQRNFQVWWYGLGTGFPIVTLFTLISSYRKASRGEPLKWEVSTGARSYAKGGAVRTVVTALICLAIYAALLANEDQDSTFGFEPTKSASEAEWLERELEAAANYVNRDVPMLVDEYTQLDGAIAGPGRSLTYRYTLIETYADELSDSVLRDFENTMTEQLRMNTCGNADMKSFLDSGVRFVYRYEDSVGRLVAQFEVNDIDCGP